MQFRFTRTLVLVAALSVAAAGCGRYSIGSIRSAKAFQDGLAQYTGGNFTQAAQNFEEAIRLNPGFGFTYFFLGNSYDKMYRPSRKGEAENDAYLTKAVDNYRKSIEHLKTSTEPQAAQFLNLSYQYLIAAYGSDRLNDFEKAEAAAKELIASTPDEPGNYQALGRLYQEQGRNEEAEAMFIKGAEVKPSDPVGYQLLANFYNQQGEFDKTVAAFEKRAAIEPNNPEAWHTMGTFYYEKVLRDTRLPLDTARKYLAAGLAAEDRALALNKEYYEAISYKNMLLSLQANKEANPETKKRLLAEAKQYYDHAMEIRKKQDAAAAAAKKQQ
jgi:tetratricopeptide (TPR) repeat protein